MPDYMPLPTLVRRRGVTVRLHPATVSKPAAPVGPKTAAPHSRLHKASMSGLGKGDTAA
jgi:hypothetical protein